MRYSLAHFRFSCFTTKPTIPFFTGGRSRLGRILYNKTKCQPYHDHGNGAFFSLILFRIGWLRVYMYVSDICFTCHGANPPRLCMLRIASRTLRVKCYIQSHSKSPPTPTPRGSRIRRRRDAHKRCFSLVIFGISLVSVMSIC